MGEARRRKYNTLAVGISLGFGLPLAAFIILYFLKYSQVPFFTFVADLWEMKLLVKLLSLCGFFNLVAFLFFYRKHMDLAARGVIMATFVYAMIVLLSRII